MKNLFYAASISSKRQQRSPFITSYAINNFSLSLCFYFLSFFSMIHSALHHQIDSPKISFHSHYSLAQKHFLSLTPSGFYPRPFTSHLRCFISPSFILSLFPVHKTCCRNALNVHLILFWEPGLLFCCHLFFSWNLWLLKCPPLLFNILSLTSSPNATFSTKKFSGNTHVRTFLPSCGLSLRGYSSLLIYFLGPSLSVLIKLNDVKPLHFCVCLYYLQGQITNTMKAVAIFYNTFYLL